MRNLTMMTDLYELTMMNGYLRFGMENNRACFDIFYRKQGDMTAYAVAAGLEQAIDYVRNLHFSNEDIAYLRSLNIFDEAFLARLATLRFTGEILAVPEGTIIFPGEPIIRVIAPIYGSAAAGNRAAQHHQPPDADRHQGLLASCRRPAETACHGVRPSPRAGTGRRYLRRTRSHNRRLSRRQATCSPASSSAFLSAARMHTAGSCLSRTS